MSTTTKQMKAYLTKLQMWQRKAVTNMNADFNLEVSFTDKYIIIRVSVWAREDGQLKRDEQSDLIGGSFDMSQYKGESENSIQMDAIERLLHDFNVL